MEKKTYLISIGGLRVKNLLKLPRFLKLTLNCHRVARVHPGCHHLELTRRKRIFFEYSVWQDEAAMMDYVSDPAHKDAMVQSGDVLLSFYNKQFTSETIPTINEAIGMWMEDPKSQRILG